MQIDEVHEIERADTPVWGGVGAAVQEPPSKVETSPEGPTSVQVLAELHVTATPTIADGGVGTTLQARAVPVALEQLVRGAGDEVAHCHAPARKAARHAVQVAALRGRRANC